MALFEQALYGGTRFSKVLKQTVYLKNVFTIDYIKKYNIIPGNNMNVTYVGQIEVDATKEFDKIDLRGALVGNPLLNGRTGVMFLYLRSNALYIFVIDMDYSSLYPNIKITSNIAPYTQWGRLIILEQCIENENPDNDPKFMRGGRLIEDYETDDTSEVAKWIGIKDITKYINKYSEWRLHHEP